MLSASVGDFNFKKVIAKLGDVMYKFPFSLPPFYIAIIRCVGVLEGLALQVYVHHIIMPPPYSTLSFTASCTMNCRNCANRWTRIFGLSKTRIHSSPLAC